MEKRSGLGRELGGSFAINAEAADDVRMLRYYRRPWDEDRGDEFADWGTSVWYFEVGEDDYPLRQLELYQSGIALFYDESHVEDHFGGLSEAALDPAEFTPFSIGAAEFEQAWSGHKPHNR
ncbi:MAG: hypothetical protein QM755_06875 [Luteolibacter sp.]